MWVLSVVTVHTCVLVNVHMLTHLKVTDFGISHTHFTRCYSQFVGVTTTITEYVNTPVSTRHD